MKLGIIAAAVLTSAQAFAFTTLNCHVVEAVFAPLEARSLDYTISGKLRGANAHTSIDLQSRSLNLEFGVSTFIDSAGNQVVLIGGREIGNNGFSSFGTEKANLTYDEKGGELFVDCKAE